MLERPRPARSWDRRRPPPAVVARIRTLAPHHTDSQIATVLKQAGLTPGLGGTFTASKVAWIRYVSAIPAGCPEAPGVWPDGQRGDGRSSARPAAQLLNVAVRTLADWCRAGQLEYVQHTPHSPAGSPCPLSAERLCGSLCVNANPGVHARAKKVYTA
jgi:hypothetical protein